MSTLTQIKKDMTALVNPQKAAVLASFFKTGQGQYAEGDKFLGIMVPQVRQLVRKYHTLELGEIRELLQSEFHEVRLLGILIMVHRYEKGSRKERQEIFDAYLANIKRINNWDLVDLSADRIIGAQLADRPKKLLQQLATSANLWERRIAILATFHDIKKGDCESALKIAQQLLFDKEDLIQKAVGWMLREVGKRCSQEDEEQFLDEHAAVMPRTMLRYALERFPLQKRKHYMELRRVK